MKPCNSKDRRRVRQLEALDRRLIDLATLTEGKIPGETEIAKGDLDKIIAAKLVKATTDIANLRSKLGPINASNL